MDETATADDAAPTEEWVTHHFDYAAPQLGQHLHETLAHMRQKCPIVHSDAHDGTWIVTKYEDVLRIAQDWQTFSNTMSADLTAKVVVPPLPEVVDPPIHREYKRLINAYLTPAAVAHLEQPTRETVTRLIDRFIERGRCDFQAEFARPFPGLVFFEQVLHAPSDQVAEINDMSTTVSLPTPKAAEAWKGMFDWIVEFVDQRRKQPPRGDVVDGVVSAQIEGRPITDTEIYGIIQLLILGGLDTTAGALGQFMIRFAKEPDIPELLRRQPELIPQAVEELLRLDGPFVSISRRATTETAIRGRQIGKDERVLIYWASANHDEDEFPNPDAFDLHRESNRHLTFGAGPHRCAGSNLARLNLCVALEELLSRLHDIRLAEGAEPIQFHSAFNRAPMSVPITFRPGARRLTAR